MLGPREWAERFAATCAEIEAKELSLADARGRFGDVGLLMHGAENLGIPHIEAREEILGYLHRRFPDECAAERRAAELEQEPCLVTE